MSQPPATPGSSFEDVLASALVAHDAEGPGGFERILARHPQLADRLREHLDRLRGYGLIAKTQVATGTGPARDFPEQLGDFRLLERLGGGGMGVVYLAEQQSLHRRVALKLVRNEHLYFPGAVERFRREVEAVAKLQHPGIVPVFQAGEDGGIPWLAMEHVVGASLDEVVRRLQGRDPSRLSGRDLQEAVLAVVQSRRPQGVGPAGGDRGDADATSPFAGSWPTACLRLVRGVAIALQHAHERGVLHRDVKPSNVMLTLDGRPLLLDFGLAHADGSTRLTGTGSQLGSPAYMSPEQMRGDARHLDARTDVYSLGVTLYELLTLRMPFAGESAASTRELVLAGRPAPMRVLNRTITRDADVVCRKAMDVEAARRYPTAAAFADDLDNVLALRPIRARPPTRWLIARRWAQRHPAQATAALAAVLLFGVAPTAFLLQQQAKNRDVSAALATARQQRDRAREAVDTLLTRVADETLLDLPRMMPVRRDLLASARAFYERFLAEAGDDPELRSQAAETALRLASVELKLGQVERALAAATRAETLARSLAPNVDRALLRHVLTVKGSALQTLSRLDDALAAFTAARAECDAALQSSPDDLEAHVEGIAVERGLALIHSQLQHTDEAAATYLRLPARWARAAAATAGTEHHEACRDEMVCAAADEADLHIARGDVEAVRDTIQRSLDLLADTAPSQRSVAARIAEAKLGLTRGRVAGAEGDAEAAESHMRAALANARSLLDDYPDYATALRTKAAVLNDLAMVVHRRSDGRDEVRRLYDESIATLRRLLEQDPGVAENRANLAATLTNVGSDLLDEGDPARARTLFAEALELASSALADAPTRSQWRTVVHNAAWFLGQACGAVGDHVGQAAAAGRLAASRPDDPRTQRIAAGLLAQSLTALAGDASWTEPARSERRAKLEGEAMAVFARAAELGCADAEWVTTSAEFAPLRALPGAAAVLQRVAANAAAGKR